MEVKQIYEVVNSITEQAIGLKALTATDTSFVAVGNAVLSSDTNKEAWYNVLLDRIGKTVMSMRAYTANGAELKRDPIEWGIVMQKLSIPLPKAKKNDSWNGQSVTATNPFEKSLLTPRQKIFYSIATWEVDATIPDIQLKTAFTSPEAMGAFIDGIFTAVYNSLEVSYENTANLCRANFIARKSKSNNTNAYINLLTLYNTETSNTLTAENCLFNADFLKFCSMQINLYTNRLASMSTLFNDEDVERHTPKDAQVVNVLSDFSARMDVYLQSDTFHNELTKLPNYKPVPYWQGSGTSYSFADTSKVVVNYDGTNDVTVNGVIAVIYDKEAMGVTVNNKRTKSIYNPREEYTNYFYKADIGYYNDMSENGIVFYIANA